MPGSIAASPLARRPDRVADALRRDVARVHLRLDPAYAERASKA
jgi:hypothetical protein